jgi:hypothetical protein
MLRFVESLGNTWDVVVGRESWGAVVALFVPVKSGQPMRQALLGARSPDEGLRELSALSPEELEQLFARSTELNTEPDGSI